MPPLIIPALVVSTVASTAISIASAAGAFTPGAPKIPEAPLPPDETEAAKARREELRVGQSFNRRRTTVIGAGSDEEFSPSVGNATILG